MPQPNNEAVHLDPFEKEKNKTPRSVTPSLPSAGVKRIDNNNKKVSAKQTALKSRSLCKQHPDLENRTLSQVSVLCWFPSLLLFPGRCFTILISDQLKQMSKSAGHPFRFNSSTTKQTKHRPE